MYGRSSVGISAPEVGPLGHDAECRLDYSETNKLRSSSFLAAKTYDVPILSDSKSFCVANLSRTQMLSDKRTGCFQPLALP